MFHDPDDPITVWSDETPWSSILNEDAWRDTLEVDTCGCALWTAPGDHASPKSATAHERHCLDFDGAFLHVWTTHPPEFLFDAGSNVSKLQYVTYRDYQGDFRTAMGALRLSDGRSLLAASQKPSSGSDDDDPFGLGDLGPTGTKEPKEPGAQPPLDEDEFLDRLQPLDWPSLFTAKREIKLLPAKFGERGHQIAFVAEASQASRCSCWNGAGTR